jgi:hypothetical protein
MKSVDEPHAHGVVADVLEVHAHALGHPAAHPAFVGELALDDLRERLALRADGLEEERLFAAEVVVEGGLRAAAGLDHLTHRRGRVPVLGEEAGGLAEDPRAQIARGAVGRVLFQRRHTSRSE